MIRSFFEPIEILLVEDSPSDIRLTQEALKETKLGTTLNIVEDGDEALDYLYQRGDFAHVRWPDLVLLDLNLPSLDGREVLARMKQDDDLKHIPVIVLTTSYAEEDITRSYALHANCYVTKPLDLDQFINVVRAIENFWFSIVKLPRR